MKIKMLQVVNHAGKYYSGEVDIDRETAEYFISLDFAVDLTDPNAPKLPTSDELMAMTRPKLMKAAAALGVHVDFKEAREPLLTKALFRLREIENGGHS